MPASPESATYRYFVYQLDPKTGREVPEFGRLSVPPKPADFAGSQYRWALEVARRATEYDRKIGGGRRYAVLAVDQTPRQLGLPL